MRWADPVSRADSPYIRSDITTFVKSNHVYKGSGPALVRSVHTKLYQSKVR